MRSELRQREKTVVGEVFKSAQVVLATLAASGEVRRMAAEKKLPEFDCVVIDEAAQALEVKPCAFPYLARYR